MRLNALSKTLQIASKRREWSTHWRGELLFRGTWTGQRNGLAGILEWLRLDWTSGGPLVQPPCSGRASCPGLCPGSISKDGDSTALLGNLHQCSVTVKKHFVMFRGNISCFGLGPLLLVLSLSTTEKSPAPPSLQLQVFIYIEILPPETSPG